MSSRSESAKSDSDEYSSQEETQEALEYEDEEVANEAT